MNIASDILNILLNDIDDTGTHEADRVIALLNDRLPKTIVNGKPLEFYATGYRYSEEEFPNGFPPEELEGVVLKTTMGRKRRYILTLRPLSTVTAEAQ